MFSDQVCSDPQLITGHNFTLGGCQQILSTPYLLSVRSGASAAVLTTCAVVLVAAASLLLA